MPANYSWFAQLKEHLRTEEGTGPRDSKGNFWAYLDHLGYLTIGYGQLVAETDLSIKDPLIITLDQAEAYLTKRSLQAVRDAEQYSAHYSFDFDSLSDTRKVVLSAMAYQLGLPRLLKFKNLGAALHQGSYEEAAAEILDSKMARDDSPARALRLSTAMRKG